MSTAPTRLGFVREPANLKALGGVIVWLVLFDPPVGGESWTHALLLFNALVLVPLVLELLKERNDTPTVARWFGWAGSAQLPTAVLLAVACGIRPGLAAACLALPWTALTALLALIGFRRAVRHGWARPLDRLGGDIAMAFAGIGGLWVLADRAGIRPLGFDAAIVALTAVHFHYAGLLLPMFAGLVHRQLPDSRFAARALVGVILGVPAVAFGITTTQLGWGTAIETAAGMGLALAGMAVAVLHVRIATEPAISPLARVLLGVAGVSLFFGMVLACLYAVRSFASPFPWLGLPQMRLLHGTANAIGFGLCGVLGWRVAVKTIQS